MPKNSRKNRKKKQPSFTLNHEGESSIKNRPTQQPSFARNHKGEQSIFLVEGDVTVVPNNAEIAVVAQRLTTCLFVKITGNHSTVFAHIDSHYMLDNLMEVINDKFSWNEELPVEYIGAAVSPFYKSRKYIEIFLNELGLYDSVFSSITPLRLENKLRQIFKNISFIHDEFVIVNKMFYALTIVLLLAAIASFLFARYLFSHFTDNPDMFAFPVPFLIFANKTLNTITGGTIVLFMCLASYILTPNQEGITVNAYPGRNKPSELRRDHVTNDQFRHNLFTQEQQIHFLEGDPASIARHKERSKHLLSKETKEIYFTEITQYDLDQLPKGQTPERNGTQRP